MVTFEMMARAYMRAGIRWWNSEPNARKKRKQISFQW